MANRLKMVQEELLLALFAQDWSIRKINKLAGIHRKTITRYRKEWLNSQDEKPWVKNALSKSHTPSSNENLSSKCTNYARSSAPQLSANAQSSHLKKQSRRFS